VLEPIFEADFTPVSYGFRRMRRAHDAVAEIQRFGTKGCRWVLDADIEACFDSIEHSALLDRVRARVENKRVLALVKAFLKAGVMTELGIREASFTGTPQGGILSPLLANIALHALDEHVHGPWMPGGIMSTPRPTRPTSRQGPAELANRPLRRRFRRPRARQPGRRRSLARRHRRRAGPAGLRLSEAKTRTMHMGDGFDFLGFHIRWRRKPGTTKWYVYTFIADRPVRSLKDKVRALTSRLSQQPPMAVVIRLNQIMRGWSAYFRHAVAKHTMSSLENFVWHRVIRWWKTLHRWRWQDVRRHHTAPTGQWARPSVDGIELFNLAKVQITRYLYRGNKIPNPWTLANHA
jgi:RNA-directed DNA polymerase